MNLSEPHIELAFMACVLMSEPDEAKRLVNMIDSEDMSVFEHELLMDCMQTVAYRDEVLNPMTLSGELERRKHLQDLGGHDAIMNILDHVTTPSAALTYARRIKAMSQSRALNIAMAEAKMALNEKSAAEVFTDLMREAGNILKDGMTATVTPEMVLNDDNTYRLSESSVWTGIKQIDDLLPTGIAPGHMFVIGASTSVGKTAMMLNIAWNATMRNGAGARVAYFAAEMQPVEITIRLLGIAGAIPLWAVHKLLHQPDAAGDHNQYAGAFNAAQESLAESPIEMSVKRGLTPSTINDMLYGLEVDLVIIDYLQRLKSAGGSRDLYHRMTEISGDIADLAGNHKVPVIIGSQLSRSAKHLTGSDKPGLHHLRDSGAIEQDADMVALLSRPQDQVSADEELTFDLAKNRHGPLGTVKLNFNLPSGRITDNAPYRPQEGF